MSIPAWLLKLNETMRRAERRPRLWLTGIVLLLAVQISPWWYVSTDGSAYIGMARGLAEGEPLLELGSRFGTPPGYPLMISPAFAFGDRPFLALAAVNWLIAAGLIAGVYRWSRRQVPEAAFWIAALTAANAGVWYYYRRTMKELAFMTVAVWAAEALHAMLSSPDRRRFVLRLGAALLLMALLVSIRYSGIVLAGGFVAAVVLRMRGAAALSIPSVACALLLTTVGAVVVGLIVTHMPGGYLLGFDALMADLVPSMVEGLRLRLSEIQRLTIPCMFKAYGPAGDWWDWNTVLGLWMTAIVFWGWRRLAFERRDVLALTLPLYAGLYVLWPFDQGARYMVPMVPVLIACFWVALERIRPMRVAFFGACLVAHLGASAGYWLVVDAPRAMADHRSWDTADALAAGISLDRGWVGAEDLPNALRSMLTVAIDRLVVDLSGRGAIEDGRFDWIVQPGAAPRPEFDLYAMVDGYAVLRRRKAAAVPVLPKEEALSESGEEPWRPLRTARRGR
ncbi:MAG: hypothetical protein KY476_04040 [Planctomycetes bacterium]|nr:hypothetical protein [Planctomycetota bacterium]